MAPSPASGACCWPDLARSLDLRARDGRFALRVDTGEMRTILNLSTGAGARETGGILAGYYEEELDRAVVTAVLGPPPDSRSGKTWFDRGVEGVQVWLDDLWRTNGHHYLGDWHSHPSMAARPSGRDFTQMRAFAASPQYHCPQPILLIVGGSPATRWSAQAFVVPARGQPVELVQPDDRPNSAPVGVGR